MRLVDLSHALTGRAIPCVAIRVKSTRHCTKCRVDNFRLGLAMNAQNLIVIDKRGHNVSTTSGNVEQVQIVTRRLAHQSGAVISSSRSSVSTSAARPRSSMLPSLGSQAD